MAAELSGSRTSNFNIFEQWVLITGAAGLVCLFIGYVLYEAVMATAYELLQRLLVISPLLLIIAVHWLSSGSHLSLPIPGSEPGAIHRAGGSPWGVAFVWRPTLMESRLVRDEANKEEEQDRDAPRRGTDSMKKVSFLR
ncbi:hypothetical protein ACFE04_007015 [Oxalis oulophora]